MYDRVNIWINSVTKKKNGFNWICVRIKAVISIHLHIIKIYLSGNRDLAVEATRHYN
jgi:hypothetical protein